MVFREILFWDIGHAFFYRASSFIPATPFQRHTILRFQAHSTKYSFSPSKEAKNHDHCCRRFGLCKFTYYNSGYPCEINHTNSSAPSPIQVTAKKSILHLWLCSCEMGRENFSEEFSSGRLLQHPVDLTTFLGVLVFFSGSLLDVFWRIGKYDLVLHLNLYKLRN